MKHSLLRLSILALLLAINTVVLAVEFEVNGIKYKTTSSSTVEVSSKRPNYSGDIIIPEVVTNNKNTYSVTSIGGYAFYVCSSLASVTIPNSVTSIGHGAFQYCSSLTSVTIPNSVTSIGSSAFEGCQNLVDIQIPSSVKTIGNKAFYACGGLKSIRMEEGVTSIGEYAFWVNDVDSVVVPNSVKTIGEGAFRRIHYIVVGNGIEKLAKNFALDCDSIKFHCSIGDSWFYLNKLSVKRLIFAEGCKTIGSLAFFQCPIVSVDFGKTVESIGKEAFYKCNIRTLNMRQASSLKSIRDDAFYLGCHISEFYIPKSVNSIGYRAFMNQGGTITHVTFEDSDNPLSVGWSSFCNSYTDDNGIVVYMGRNVNISDAFVKNQVRKVIFGDKVTETGRFENFANLSIVKMGKNVKTFSFGAFAGCLSLGSIFIPEGVEEIPKGCFYNCHSLTHVDIPNTVTKIGTEAFAGAHILDTHLIIPSSIKEIGDLAFAGHPGDTIIFVSKELPKMEHTTFYNRYYVYNTLYIPRGATNVISSLYLVNTRYKEYDNIEDIFNGNLNPSNIEDNIYKSDSSELYDLKGYRIRSGIKPSKGIYIKNGKKVIIK